MEDKEPSKKKIDWSAYDLDELCCPICMEPWTSQGDHQVCCLPCGHVYGNSCIIRWEKWGGHSTTCPQCNSKFGLKDIKKLYTSPIVILGDDLQKNIKSLEEMKKTRFEFDFPNITNVPRTSEQRREQQQGQQEPEQLRAGEIAQGKRLARLPEKRPASHQTGGHKTSFGASTSGTPCPQIQMAKKREIKRRRTSKTLAIDSSFVEKHEIKAVADTKAIELLKKQKKLKQKIKDERRAHKAVPDHYRSNLKSICDLVKTLELRDDHKTLLKKTPFWYIFNAIFKGKLNSEKCTKADDIVFEVLQCYDKRNKSFKLGKRKEVKFTEKDITLIFGIKNGTTFMNYGHGNKPDTPFVRRRCPGNDRFNLASIAKTIKEVVVSNKKTDVEDVVRLLCLHLSVSCFFATSGNSVGWGIVKCIENIDEMTNYNWSEAIYVALTTSMEKAHAMPTRITGCVIALLYWFCEHTTVIEAIKDGFPRIVKWNLRMLRTAMENQTIQHLSSKKVLELEMRETLIEEVCLFNGGEVTEDVYDEDDDKEDESTGDDTSGHTSGEDTSGHNSGEENELACNVPELPAHNPQIFYPASNLMAPRSVEEPQQNDAMGVQRRSPPTQIAASAFSKASPSINLGDVHPDKWFLGVDNLIESELSATQGKMYPPKFFAPAQDIKVDRARDELKRLFDFGLSKLDMATASTEFYQEQVKILLESPLYQDSRAAHLEHLYYTLPALIDKYKSLVDTRDDSQGIVDHWGKLVGTLRDQSAKFKQSKASKHKIETEIEAIDAEMAQLQARRAMLASQSQRSDLEISSLTSQSINTKKELLTYKDAYTSALSTLEAAESKEKELQDRLASMMKNVRL